MSDSSAMILILEDDDVIRTALSEGLRALGYLPLEFSDAMAALKSMETDTQPNLLLVDISLPGEMGGLQFVRAYNERPNPRPVILMSGHTYSGEEWAELRGDYGVAAFLPKPFRLNVLSTMVRTILAEP